MKRIQTNAIQMKGKPIIGHERETIYRASTQTTKQIEQALIKRGVKENHRRIFHGSRNVYVDTELFEGDPEEILQYLAKSDVTKYDLLWMHATEFIRIPPVIFKFPSMDAIM